MNGSDLRHHDSYVAGLAGTPARTVVDALDRFAELYPGKLGRQTLHRIEDVASLAVTLRSRDDDGRGEEIRQSIDVAACFLADEAGLTVADLVPIFGRPAQWLDVAQRRGRAWVECYAAEMGRRGRPFDVTPRIAGRKGLAAIHRKAVLAAGRR